MAEYVRVYWNDQLLKAKIAAAQVEAVQRTAQVAKTACRWSHVRKTIRGVNAGNKGAVVVASSDAALLEKGARPHAISAEGGTKARVLKFTHGDGGFSSVPVQHPGMKGHPFLRPAAVSYPPNFNAAARRRLA